MAFATQGVKPHNGFVSVAVAWAGTILALNVMASVPASPQPGNGAAEVFATTNLTWSNGPGGEWIRNGGFETGTLTNWMKQSTGAGDFVIDDGTYLPPGPGSNSPTPPFAGNFSVTSEQNGPGTHVLYQDVTVPGGSDSAALTWADEIRNFAPNFATNQCFRVEIRKTDDSVLQVVFTTHPGDPLLNYWVTRNVDLSAYIGQTIRVAFVDIDSASYLNVHLDNISVQTVGGTAPFTNDVYFGTNPAPGPAELAGTTTNNFWTLPLLDPLTTYYWQIVAHNSDGTTSGPVWQFTTAGVDHFVWNAIDPHQIVNQPFNVTLTALDILGRPVNLFTNPVSLSATSIAGTSTNTMLGGVPHTSFHNLATYTLGNSFTPNTNVLVTHVRSYSGTKVSIWTESGTLLTSQVVSGPNGAWTETPLAVPLPLNAGSTYRVTFYTAGANYYFRTDGSNTFTNGVFNQAYESLGDVFPTNVDNNVRWWMVDLRYTVQSPLSIPISPSVSGIFSNGVWTGSISVLQPATNLFLTANDGNGHRNDSNLINAGLADDISIGIADSPRPAVAGQTLNYTLTVTNMGPSDATAVAVTNVLPAGVIFVSATASQGTCTQANGVVTASLGTMPGGTGATVTIVGVPTIAGTTLTNSATISRAEIDGYLGNNAVQLLSPVAGPGISISDASRAEGNVGISGMVFTITLSAPSAQTVRVNYATTNGSAMAGTDYLSTNGVVIFPAGIAATNVTVKVIGDTAIEPDENMLVNLSAATNGALVRSQGVGTILNDDGMPGQVDHFVWDTISSTQFVTLPFGVTIHALDISNNVVSAFGGSVDLTAAHAVATSTNTMLGGLPNTDGHNLGTYTLGNSFTPSTNLLVTHVRSYSGTKVSIWTESGTLLTSQNVSGTNGSWTETPLAVPVQLNAGSTYRVTFYTAGANYYYRTDSANTFSNGVFNQAYESLGDVFPTNVDNNVRWWMVDLRYTVQTPVSVAVSPTLSGNFTNGVWSGPLNVTIPATGVMLRADDRDGHAGLSNPFAVLVTNDISLSIVDAPRPAVAGQTLSYILTVTNIGASAATAVAVTNVLPIGFTFVSATASQGTCTQANGVVTASLGTVPGGTAATVTIAGVPTIAGTTLTNSATVSRAEVDGYLGNNAVQLLSPVAGPGISISDTSRTEGNVGTTGMVFTITLSAPSAQTVRVNYATTNGSAVAGTDYIGTNGVVIFPAGSTGTNVTVTVIGDTALEADETLLVNLSAATNGTLIHSQGVGTILNDDGFPGQVDHFVWDTISATQFVGVPFGVTIHALDISNNVVSAFGGSVDLTATRPVATSTNTMLGGVPHTTFHNLATYTLGNSFTPNTNLLVTHVRSYSGTKVSIWTESGTLLTSQSVSGPNGAWTETPLAVPLQLTAGSTYRVTFYTAGANYYFRTDSANTFTNGVFNQAYESLGDVFPTTVDSNVRWWMVDLRYSVLTPMPVAMAPSTSGNFINGVWSGNASVFQAVTNVVLSADDRNGHRGSSNPFNVTPLSPQVLAQPSNQRASLGCDVSFQVTGRGTPFLTYQWSKEGSPLNGETNATLVLNDIGPSDYGAYQVVISNLYGFMISSNAFLLTNQLPVCAPDTVERFASGGLRISPAELLANDSDPEGDPIAVIGVLSNTPAGATVELRDGWIYYTPLPGLTDPDTFNYTVSDGRCGSAIGTVTVQVKSDDSPARPTTIQVAHDGSFNLTFDGVPFQVYRIQYADILPTTNWIDFATQTADFYGVYEWTDPSVSNAASRFYRSVSP
jgi:uncharacterized repeat protein (TIGR01451 family)